MATENRTPDDLREAVAATLRRLRGEARHQVPAPSAQRTEPQLSMSIRDEVRPAAADKSNLTEHDLLTGAEPEIPPPPAAHSVMREGAMAYDKEAAKSNRRWLPYVLSLTAIVAFASIVWWAYHAVVGAPRNGEVPVIAADQTPAKVPPADQGAANGSGQEKTVYDQISGTNTQPKSEVLLPAPENPQAPPPPAPPPSASETTTANSTSETFSVLPPAAPATAASGSTTTRQAGSNTADTGTSVAGTTNNLTSMANTQQSATALADTGTPAAATTSPSEAGLSGVPTLAPTLQAPASTMAVTSPADSSGLPEATTQNAAVADNFRIQLAALKSEAEAKKAWDRMLAKHSDVLGPLTVHIVRTDLASQGIYYRVQAGPFADKASAKAICDQLKTKGQQCLVKP